MHTPHWPHLFLEMSDTFFDWASSVFSVSFVCLNKNKVSHMTSPQDWCDMYWVRGCLVAVPVTGHYICSSVAYLWFRHTRARIIVPSPAHLHKCVRNSLLPHVLAGTGSNKGKSFFVCGKHSDKGARFAPFSLNATEVKLFTTLACLRESHLFLN